MLGTRLILLEPSLYASLVIDAKTGKSCDGVSLFHIHQTNGTFARINRQHVLVVRNSRLGDAHDKVNFHVLSRNQLSTHSAHRIFLVEVMGKGLGNVGVRSALQPVEHARRATLLF